MTMFWKNTHTLDAFVPCLGQTVAPEDAEVAVIGSKPVDMMQFPRLRGIFKCGIGLDNVPFDVCNGRGIKVGLPSSQTASIIYEETAAYAVGLVFRMLFSNVGDLITWQKFARPYVADRTVLVMGKGNIGKRVLEKLKGTVKVLTYDIQEDVESDLETRMRLADVVTLHVPLDATTKGMLDERKLGWMRDGAALVNTARGPIVDELALLKEIKDGRLRAAFDVFWNEPYRGSLSEYHPDRFFMSPHVASTNEAFLKSLGSDFSDFVSRLNMESI